MGVSDCFRFNRPLNRISCEDREEELGWTLGLRGGGEGEGGSRPAEKAPMFSRLAKDARQQRQSARTYRTGRRCRAKKLGLSQRSGLVGAPGKESCRAAGRIPSSPSTHAFLLKPQTKSYSPAPMHVKKGQNTSWEVVGRNNAPKPAGETRRVRFNRRWQLGSARSTGEGREMGLTDHLL